LLPLNLSFKNLESVATTPQFLEEILPSGCSKSGRSFSGLGYPKAQNGAPKVREAGVP
jgi:hypothetical protein